VIDCHTHLTSLRDDPAVALARARAAGVGRIVTIGSSPEEMAQAAAVADDDQDVFVTAGLHPHHAAEWSDAVAEEIRRRAAHPRCVAIGETGLDWYRDRAPRERQLDAFRGQLAIARELALPIVIHCREAEDDVFAILAEEAPATVVLHCFAAVGRLDEAVERGWFCSFAGNVTYPSATDLQDAARRAPAELVLLETDAPYLAPVPHRGRPNEPAYVMDTLRFVAGLRGVEPHLLEREVETNAERAFELPSTTA
jgi:TatD DNase family protein